ncbi:MAG: hypothetical protein AB7E49_03380 [Campylobacterales bacterium]
MEKKTFQMRIDQSLKESLRREARRNKTTMAKEVRRRVFSHQDDDRLMLNSVGEVARSHRRYMGVGNLTQLDYMYREYVEHQAWHVQTKEKLQPLMLSINRVLRNEVFDSLGSLFGRNKGVDDRYDCRFLIQLSETELLDLAGQASKSGISVAELIRQRLQARPLTQHESSRLFRLLEKANYNFEKIPTATENINTLARLYNTGQMSPKLLEWDREARFVLVSRLPEVKRVWEDVAELLREVLNERRGSLAPAG